MRTHQLIDHMFHVTLILCTEEEDFYRKIKKFEYDGAHYPNAGGASTIYLDTAQQGFVILVTLGDDSDYPECESEFTLIHEAVHVKQFTLEAACEKNVGVETEAYMVEYYAKFLIEEYRRRKFMAKGKK